MTPTLSATPQQIEIIEDPAMIKIAICGRRWGKTVMMALYLTYVAKKYPGCHVWYVSINYALAFEIMRMMEACPAFMALVKKPHKQFPPRFDMKNGSTISFRSADRPNSLRGRGIKLICLDEAAYLDKGICFDVLSPMLMDAGGTMYIGTTYNGRNWVYDFAEQGKKGDPDIKTWTYPTSSAIWAQGPEGKIKYEKYKKLFSPATVQQELECNPLAVQDGVFGFLERVIKDTAKPKERGDNDKTYSMGLDLGRKPDFTFATVLENQTGLVCHAEQLPGGIEHVILAQMARRIWDRYPNCQCVVDATGGASGGHNDSYVRLYEQAIPNCRTVTFSRDNKTNIVNHLALRIEEGKLTIPASFTELCSQLKLYRYKVSKGSSVATYGSPPGEHDDGVASLMMAEWARKSNWVMSQGGHSLSVLGY